MSQHTRMPSIKLTVDKNLFNRLISILDCNIRSGQEAEKASRLREKLLHYSVPRIDEYGIEIADVRFFPNESSDMIWQLLLQNDNNEIVEDYFSIISNRRKSE